MSNQKKKAGRPFESFKHGEEKTERLEIRLTPTAKKWLEGKPRGWLSGWIERQAREVDGDFQQ